MKMNALRITQPGPAEYRLTEMVEVGVPEPGPGELRVRVSTCGVCHTDLHEVEGDIPLPNLPMIPGHEIVGVVDKYGEDVTGPPLGTRVGIPWLGSTCGQCRFCQNGRENLCENIRFTGLHTDGGYAGYTIVRHGFYYPIPARFSDVEAAPLLCAGVIGYRALRLALPPEPLNHRSPGPFRLGLYGFGASAHICLQIARHRDFEVAVFTRAEGHRNLARELGAAWVGSAEDKPPWRLDAGVIFAPVGELVPVALRHLDKGGTLALAGIHMSTIPQMEYVLVYEERVVRSVANSTRHDVNDLLKLADQIPLKTTAQAFPFAKVQDALLAVKYSETRGAAVLVMHDQDRFA